PAPLPYPTLFRSRPADSRCTATRHGTRWRRPRAAAGPRRRSTGSRRELLVRSSQVGLLGARHPLGEPLAVVTLVDESAHHPLDVVAQLGAGDLVCAQLAAEPGVQPEAATQVHLEALDLVARLVGDDLALQADVGG